MEGPEAESESSIRSVLLPSPDMLAELASRQMFRAIIGSNYSAAGAAASASRCAQTLRESNQSRVTGPGHGAITIGYI